MPRSSLTYQQRLLLNVYLCNKKSNIFYPKTSANAHATRCCEAGSLPGVGIGDLVIKTGTIICFVIVVK